MQNYYATSYDEAVKFANSTKNNFYHSATKMHIGQVECLNVECMGIHYMTIFWDQSLYDEAPRFQQVN